jgi:hypothetical protein
LSSPTLPASPRHQGRPLLSASLCCPPSSCGGHGRPLVKPCPKAYATHADDRSHCRHALIARELIATAPPIGSVQYRLARGRRRCVFSFIRCSECGCSAFAETRGLIVVFGWTDLRVLRGEPTGVCRGCGSAWFARVHESATTVPRGGRDAVRVDSIRPVALPAGPRAWF